MDKQLLVYQRAVPVSSERHKGMSVEAGADYSFARDLNAVPIVIGEFTKIAQEYPIIFVEASDVVQPMALVGLRNDENLLVAEDGSWSGSYVPAFLRRYPFVFHHRDGKDEFVLCIDEDYAGVNDLGMGRALFDEEGEASDYLKRMLDFTTTYQKEAQLTRSFGDRLKELDILEDAQVTFKLKDGSSAATRGMKAVDKDRLKRLDGKSLEDLAKNGDLERLYAHVFSLANVDRLGPRLSSHAG